MKKRIVIVTICVGIIMVVCGCQPKVRRIGNTVSSTQISNNSSSESVESFDVNKTVYEDNLVVLKCKEITDRYILFEVVNKTDYEIEWLNLQTSLDGVQLPLYSYDSSDKNITAQETREIEMDGEIGQAEHNRISLSGNVFIDGTSKGEIDVCDLELGGKENVPEIKTQNQIYDDELVTIYYNDLVIDNMEFCVDNKTDHAITVGFWDADSLSINGQQYTSSVVTINAHSKGIYSGYISSMDGNDVQIMQVDSFQGIFGIKDQNNNYIEDINLNFSEK